MQLIEDWNWRYATKKFDPNKKLNQDQLDKLKEAVRLAPTSYGLQAFKVFIIEQKDLREKLKPVSWNQSQITDASHLFVFATYTKIDRDYINDFVKLRAAEQGKKVDEVQAYGDFILGKLEGKSEEEIAAWTGKQSYIAMSQLLTACANLRIDACPMEGFDAEAYDDLLNLKERNLHTAALVTVGFRSQDDHYADLKKVRLPEEELFETLV